MSNRRGSGDVAQWLESEFKSEDHGLNPLAGQGEQQFLMSLRVNSCADLLVPGSPFMCVWYAPNFVRTLKIPVEKRVGITAGGMEKRNRCTQRKNTQLGSAVLWLLAFPWGKAARFSCALHWDKKVI